MITIRKIIERVDRVKPNAFSIETKLGWIAELDGKIALDVLLMDRSELSKFNYEYPDALEKEPLVSFPHDAIYDKWLIAQIDAACEEWERYANDIEVYNSYFKNYVRWIASTYQPAQGGMERCGTYPRYFLTAYGLAVMQGFVGTLDEWLISLHGEPGSTPVAGEDYFTEEDKQNMLAWIREQLPNQTLELDASLTKEGFAADAKKTGDAIAARALAIRKINGKPLTDDVSLTAADVGARPGDWMPSADDVGARPSDWMPNIAEIGAAPAGLVLGHYNLASIDEVNAKILEIMASMANHTVAYFTWMGTGTSAISRGIPYNTNHWTVTIHKQHSSNYGIAHMETYGGAGCMARAVIENGAIVAWELVNPTMDVGVEFRTTERHNGKVVYVKYLDLGTLPASGDKSVSYSSESANIVSITATAISKSGTQYPFPSISSTGELNGAVSASHFNLFVSAFKDMSSFTGFAIVRYTKD